MNDIAEPLAVRGYDSFSRQIALPSAGLLTEMIGDLEASRGDEFIVIGRAPYLPHDSIQAAWDEDVPQVTVSYRTGVEPWMETEVGPGQVAALFVGWARSEPGWDRDCSWEPAEWWDNTPAPAPEPAAAAAALKLARQYVDEGYLDFDSMTRAIHEMSEDDMPVSNAQAQDILAPVWRERVAEQAAWGETDCDRLTAAFAELDARGIIARENFACCQNCGTTEIWEFKTEETRGYTFFHMQDTESAVSGSLHLAYGSRSNEPDDVVAIGHEVVKVLGDYALTVEWNGSNKQRLEVTGLDWRRRLK
jgi:hypothetical protein